MMMLMSVLEPDIRTSGADEEQTTTDQTKTIEKINKRIIIHIIIA